MPVKFILFRIALMLIFLTSASFIAAPPTAALATNNAASFIIVMLTPLSKIYEGDTITMSYFIDELGSSNLAPLIPGEASISAKLGSAKVTHRGLNGTIVYTAKKAGTEELTLSVDRGPGFGTVKGTESFTVYPNEDYDLTFLLANDEDQQGAGFTALFAGSGSFSNKTDEPLLGSGKANFWLVMWVNTQPFVCKMDPPVTGATTIDITGKQGTATGRRGSPFTLDLSFQPMSTNSSSIQCQGLGNITASFPFPATKSASMDALDLMGLNFPAGGGKISINKAKLWGAIYTWRK